MCAIIGVTPAGPLNLDWLRHRGPDGAAVVQLPKLALGHCRLAILELTERAAQPKWSQDQRVLVAYNGEIYNYRALGSSAETSDTVALAEWLAQQGPGFDPGPLDGMYAFAAYFPKAETLALARDAAGIKPLYVTVGANGEQFAFASEIKGFFGVEWFSPQPNPDATVQREFLQYGYAFPRLVNLRLWGNEHALALVPTLLAGVYQVCPGQKLMVRLGRSIRSEFIRVQAEFQSPLAALERSVLEQSMSDVEVGVQLSGGIDSSMVAWQYAQRNPEVHGFYVSVPGEGLNEDRWAAHAAGRLARLTRFSFHQVQATREEVRRIWPAVAWSMDEPVIRHPNALGVYLLSEYVRRRTAVKVLLTGEGADEVFGGYSWHDGRTLEGYDQTRRIFDFGPYPPTEQFLSRFADRPTLERQLAFDRDLYLPPILARQDRMSMAWGLETRVPFLSNRFLLQSAPLAAGKWVLKRQAAAIFGEEFARRTKCGFGFPLEWLAEFEPPAGSLDWLQLKVEPKTPFQRWALAALGQWAACYLLEGWRAHVPSHSIASDAKPATPQLTLESNAPVSVDRPCPPAIQDTSTHEERQISRVQFEQMLTGSVPAAPARVIAREGRWTTALAAGCLWRLDATQYVDGQILRQGAFELESVRRLRPLIQPGMIVADVGANFGFYTLLLSHWVGPLGRVHAFEPSPRFRSRLEDHVQRNGCDNVTLHAFGLADEDGEQTLFGGGDSATLGWHDDALRPQVEEKVLLRALDGCAWVKGLPRLDFIKVDIDGAEPLFLKGATETLRRFRPGLLLEFMQLGLLEFEQDVLTLARSVHELGYVLSSEQTGRAWEGRAAFLREVMNCSHSVNIFCLPAPESDTAWQRQHAFLKGTTAKPSRPAQVKAADEAPPSARQEPALATARLTDRQYWDQDRPAAFQPWTVKETMFSALFDRYLPRNPDFTCVEIGAYPGANLCDLVRRRGYQPVAIEFSEHAGHIRDLFAFNGVTLPRLIQQDFFSVQGEQFDVVCSFGFVEHFEDSAAVIARHFDLLKPGGYLMVSVPRLDGFQGSLYELTYTPEVWHKIATSHNPRIMNRHALRRAVAAHASEILFADYYLGDQLYFEWTAPFLKPELRWLVRYLNDVQKQTRDKVAADAFYSPHIVVIARKATASIPASPAPGLAAAAVTALQQEDLTQAERWLAAAVTEDPGYVEAVCVLADLRTRRGDIDGARAVLEAAPAEMPTGLEVRKRLAMDLQARSDCAGAERLLLECLCWAPRDRDVLGQLVGLYRHQQRFAEALAAEQTLAAVAGPPAVSGRAPSAPALTGAPTPR